VDKGILVTAIQPELELDGAAMGLSKMHRLGNVPYWTLDDLVAAFSIDITRTNGRRDQMGFTFNHAKT
jgi:hypothetical protein